MHRYRIYQDREGYKVQRDTDDVHSISVQSGLTRYIDAGWYTVATFGSVHAANEAIYMLRQKEAKALTMTKLNTVIQVLLTASLVLSVIAVVMH